MSEIGHAAAAGTNPVSSTMANLQSIAIASPLEVEPFLVNAALAERSGDYHRAEVLLREARWRDPRSAAARYLLADVWFRENKIVDGLKEMAALTRLFPAMSLQLIPALAQYSHSPGAAAQLSTIINANKNLKRPLLSALAADPDNIDLILSLAGNDLRSSDPRTQPWKSRLLTSLVKRGDYGRAYALWRNFAGLASDDTPILFNGDFSQSAAPPPFNWTYNSDNAGIAEIAHGKLRVLYYGRVDSTLASQLLLLRPGEYLFQGRVTGEPESGALTWDLICVHPVKRIMVLQIRAGSNAAKFTVPPNCQAQAFALNGHGHDTPQDSDVQIGPVRIDRIAS